MEEVNSWESWEALTEEMQGAKWDHWEQFNNEMEKMELWQRVMVMADNNLWKNALKQVADMEGDLFFYNSGNDTKRYPKIEEVIQFEDFN
ncbi:hypothetical protein NE237_000019 [Protea cynaroides]|uniref:Uncharacterized protein n=1 Tax=Protea cynaroides TaxID=273540 RepID=A0A9Q0GK53_9MAGN|nr:hypothetical protein NE237_000019 [Protea cynaroides]